MQHVHTQYTDLHAAAAARVPCVRMEGFAPYCRPNLPPLNLIHHVTGSAHAYKYQPYLLIAHAYKFNLISSLHHVSLSVYDVRGLSTSHSWTMKPFHHIT